MRITGLSLLMAIFLTFFLSCSFAPQEGLGTGRPAEFPDMLLTDARYLLGMEGSDPILIEAKEIEIYREAQQAYITDAQFSQQDDGGETIFSGTFGMALVDTKTNDMKLSGSVSIRNLRERFSIEADNLDWNHAKQTVDGGPDTLVTIIRQEHDILKGTGFHGDFATSTFEFLRMEEGILHHE